MNNFFHLFKRCDHIILLCSLLLSSIGILAIASVTYQPGTFLSREVIIQSVALLIGLLIGSVVLFMGYRFFNEIDKTVYILSIALLLSVYIPVLGRSVNGSTSWVNLGIIGFQPSEIVKIPFIILMAHHLSQSFSDSFTLRKVVVSALYGLPFILIVSKEDFGSGCVYCAVWLFMVFCSGLKVKFLLRLFLSASFLSPLLYHFLANYQKERILAFFNPTNLSLPGNYQVWNSKAAIGSAGFWGKGYLHGTQARLGFLPVPESDFIFASIVEETGFIGGFLVIFLFVILIYRALKVSKYSFDLTGTLIGMGISGMLFFQAFENISMTMGLMPVTGITLPFISYGGSSLVSCMFGIGLLLSISCYQKQ